MSVETVKIGDWEIIAQEYLVEVFYYGTLVDYMKFHSAEPRGLAWKEFFIRTIRHVDSIPFDQLPLHIGNGLMGWEGKKRREYCLKRLELG